MKVTWNIGLAAAACALAFSVPANASILSVNSAADGDYAMSCVTTWHPTTETIDVDGVQYDPMAHVITDIYATEDDPTVKMSNTIDNDTGFAWTAYQVNVYMNKTFTISEYSVTAPAGWSVSSVVQPLGTPSTILDGDAVPWSYSGTINLAGPAIPSDYSTLTYTYKVTFLGPVRYAQEMIATPEPATMGLLALGALAILRNRRTR